MNYNRVSLIPAGSVVIAVAGLFLACSTSSGPGGHLTQAQKLFVDREVAGLTHRVDRHAATMNQDGMMGSGGRPEMNDYIHDMDSIMLPFADSVTGWGMCRVEVGDSLIGPAPDSICAFNHAVDDVYDEYHQHYQRMDSLMDQGMQMGMLDEMTHHMGRMDGYLDSLHEFMQRWQASTTIGSHPGGLPGH